MFGNFKIMRRHFGIVMILPMKMLSIAKTLRTASTVNFAASFTGSAFLELNKGMECVIAWTEKMKKTIKEKLSYGLLLFAVAHF